MKTYLTFLFIVIAFLFTSCGKNNDNQDNTVNSNKRLKKFRIVSGSDTTLKFDYTYNSQNRIIATHGYAYDAAVLESEAVYTFSYNSTDTLISHMRADFTVHTIPFSETDHEYFYYDAAGKLTRDSLDFPTNSIVYNFEYFPGYFKVTTTNIFDTVICLQNINNGNIVSETDTIYSAPFTGFSVNIQNSFDNHPNPFYYTQIRRVLLYMPENFLQEDIIPASVNNPTELHTITTGSPPKNFHTRYNYTYDADGFPASVIITDVTNSTTTTGYYYY